MAGWFLLAFALWPPLPAPLPDVSENDLARFPDRETTAGRLEFADAHCQYLADRAATHGWGWGLCDAYAESCWHRDCWKALSDAQEHDFHSLAWWKEGDQLRWLRQRIGPEAYYAGAMPPCVPAYRWGHR